MNIAAHLIGAFYAFAGMVILRAMTMDRLMDVMLAALTLKPTPRAERLTSQILTLGAVLTLCSGLTLLLLSRFAPLVFLANVVVQGLYLVWAARALPPEDALEAKGRRQTTNAFFLYCVATGFVCVCSYLGVFTPWTELGGVPGWLRELLLPLLLTGGVSWYFLRDRGAKNTDTDRDSDAPQTTIPPQEWYSKPVKAVRIAPEYQCWPLWNDETGDNLHPNDLDLSNDLARRILAWDDAFQATFNQEDPMESKFPTPEEEDAYQAETRILAEAIHQEWTGDVILSLGGVREFMSLPPSRNLIVRPEYYRWPLWNFDSGNNLHPFDIGLPDDLSEAILEWNDAFQATYNEADPAQSGFKTEDARLAHEQREQEIVQMIRANRPHNTVVDETYQ